MPTSSTTDPNLDAADRLVRDLPNARDTWAAICPGNEQRDCRLVESDQPAFLNDVSVTMQRLRGDAFRPTLWQKVPSFGVQAAIRPGGMIAGSICGCAPIGLIAPALRRGYTLYSDRPCRSPQSVPDDDFSQRPAEATSWRVHASPFVAEAMDRFAWLRDRAPGDE